MWTTGPDHLVKTLVWQECERRRFWYLENPCENEHKNAQVDCICVAGSGNPGDSVAPLPYALCRRWGIQVRILYIRVWQPCWRYGSSPIFSMKGMRHTGKTIVWQVWQPYWWCGSSLTCSMWEMRHIGKNICVAGLANLMSVWLHFCMRYKGQNNLHGVAWQPWWHNDYFHCIIAM